ncbi:formate dehydrogenase accessory protein FdhE [Avibacterium paragallinarum]|uniref:formate dehydrogenase accessory protein FdhE n=1 Tax=Avibacterium paragallinarum TaxID=728 RepID=UPI001028B714|nr:formate dehydrogenase accessory protein FdhE [Avibacterium paragallinarum]RZN58460.1 formate dehydrogenase accessory protein FdhE [Avibacterium paragallinarum]
MSIKILPKDDIVQLASSFHHPVLLFSNPKNLYQRRAERLRTLAQEHPMADYLNFVANIADCQLELLNEQPVTQKIEINTETSVPLALEKWQRDPQWRDLLRSLLHKMKQKGNENVEATIENLTKAADAELEQLADKLLTQQFSEVGSDKALFLWAALSLYWVQLAQQLPQNSKMESSEDLHLCPVCNAPPTASLVHFGSEQGLRYLHCSLCESEWNLVRSKCSHCHQTGKLDYWSIDSEFAAVKAESCGDCHSYLKILYQDKDPYVESAADDLASIYLDIEMEEKGFSRSGLNPFLFPNEE